MTPYFRFSLQDVATGKYWCISNNQVALSDTQVYLLYDPKDWQELQANIKRDFEKTGLYVSYTYPLEFVKDAKRIIQHILYTYGYAKKTKYIIEKKNHTTQQYYTYLSIDIDFTQFKDSKTRHTTSVTMLDKTVAGLLKANENVTYEIPLDSANALTVNLDGIELLNHAIWVVSNGIALGNNPAQGHVWDMQLVTVEAANNLDVYSRDWFKYTNFNTQIQGHDFYYASTSKQFTLTYNVVLNVSDGTGASFNFATTGIRVYLAKRRANTNSIEHTFIDEPDFNVYFNTTYNLSGSITVTPQVGDNYYLVANVYNVSGGGVSGAALVNWDYTGSDTIQLSYYSKYPAKDIKVKRFYDVLNEVVKKATNNQCVVQSSFLTNQNTSNLFYGQNDHLDNSPWNTTLTSGNGVRGLADANIKVSLNSLIKFITNRWMLGRQLESNTTLRVESLKQQFDSTNIIATIENINEFEVTVASELIYSSVKAGYEPQTYDLLNGKYEFNTQIEMTLPTDGVGTNAMDLVSSLRPDIYGIESIRATTAQKDTTDNENDNEVFVIEVDPTPSAGKYNVLRRSGTNLNTPSSSSIYNQGFTPKRCVIANLPKIYGGLPTLESGTIKFISSLGNRAFATSLGNPQSYVDEDADIDIKTFIFNSKPLYKPFYFTFTCISDSDIFPTILANPYGVLKFKHSNGLYYSGFIVELGCILAKKDSYKVKLICAPDVNLTTLIDKN